MNRIPTFIQIAMLEILASLCLGLGLLHRVACQLGWYPGGAAALTPTGAPLYHPVDVTALCMGAFGLAMLYLAMRDIVRPRFKLQNVATPRHTGPVTVVLPGDPWSVSTYVITGHIAYLLVDLFAGAMPMLFLAATWQEDPEYAPIIYGWRWALGVWALFPIARLVFWYGLGRGPDILEKAVQSQSDTAARQDLAATARKVRRLSWALAWHPVLLMWAIIVAVLIPALLVAFLVDRETDQRLTTELVDDIFNGPGAPTSPAYAGKRFRIYGMLMDDAPVEWPRDSATARDAALTFRMLIYPRSEQEPEILVLVPGSDRKRVRRTMLDAVVAAKRADNPAIITFLGRILPPGSAQLKHFMKYHNWKPEASRENIPVVLWVDP